MPSSAKTWRIPGRYFWPRESASWNQSTQPPLVEADARQHGVVELDRQVERLRLDGRDGLGHRLVARRRVAHRQRRHAVDRRRLRGGRRLVHGRGDELDLAHLHGVERAAVGLGHARVGVGAAREGGERLDRAIELVACQRRGRPRPRRRARPSSGPLPARSAREPGRRVSGWPGVGPMARVSPPRVWRRPTRTREGGWPGARCKAWPPRAFPPTALLPRRDGSPEDSMPADLPAPLFRIAEVRPRPLIPEGECNLHARCPIPYPWRFRFARPVAHHHPRNRRKETAHDSPPHLGVVPRHRPRRGVRAPRLQPPQARRGEPDRPLDQGQPHEGPPRERPRDHLHLDRGGRAPRSSTRTTGRSSTSSTTRR